MLTKLYGHRVEGINAATGTRDDAVNARALLAGTTKALTRLCQATDQIAAPVEAERVHADADLSALYASGSSALAQMAAERAQMEISRRELQAEGAALVSCLLASLNHAEEDKEMGIRSLLGRLREKHAQHQRMREQVGELEERLAFSQSAAADLTEQVKRLANEVKQQEATLSLADAEWRKRLDACKATHAKHLAELKREHERSVQKAVAAGSSAASWFRQEAEMAKAAEREAAERSETAMAKAMATVRDLTGEQEVLKSEQEVLKSEQETLQREREREQAEAAKTLAKEQKLARQHLEYQQKVSIRRLELEQKAAHEQLEKEQKAAHERLEQEQKEARQMLNQEKKLSELRLMQGKRHLEMEKGLLADKLEQQQQKGAKLNGKLKRMRKLQELALGVHGETSSTKAPEGATKGATPGAGTACPENTASAEKGTGGMTGGAFSGQPKSPPVQPKEETELQRRAREDRRTRPSRRTLYWEVMKMRLEEHLGDDAGGDAVDAIAGALKHDHSIAAATPAAES